MTQNNWPIFLSQKKKKSNHTLTTDLTKEKIIGKEKVALSTFSTGITGHPHAKKNEI
jgi:hypothetical protein